MSGYVHHFDIDEKNGDEGCQQLLSKDSEIITHLRRQRSEIGGFAGYSQWKNMVDRLKQDAGSVFN